MILSEMGRALSSELTIENSFSGPKTSSDLNVDMSSLIVLLFFMLILNVAALKLMFSISPVRFHHMLK